MTNLKQSYHDKLSDDEKLRDAENYFSIGQDDDESVEENYCWTWYDGRILVEKGGSHAIHFGTAILDNNFRGWYDVKKNAISVVFPERVLRKLGDKKPTVDDIPTNVYNKLASRFGRTSRFVVFESMKKSQLKQIIKEIVLMLKENGMRGEWWFQDGQAIYQW